MNDEQLNMTRSSRTDETAEDIFARIQRRRALAMNGNNTERGALRQEGASSETRPTAGRHPASGRGQGSLGPAWCSIAA